MYRLCETQCTVQGWAGKARSRIGNHEGAKTQIACHSSVGNEADHDERRKAGRAVTKIRSGVPSPVKRRTDKTAPESGSGGEGKR
jgi:hypothetical protein